MNELLNPDKIREELEQILTDLYDLPKGTEISHLKYSENFTYLITNEDSGIKYVLRVNRPNYHEVEELKSELIWMDALKKDTDILMAEVILGKDGEMIQELQLSDKNNNYTCVLFSFLVGKDIRGMDLEPLRNYQKVIGSICAKLHSHVIGWEMNGTLPRFSWEEKDLLGETSHVGDWSISTDITSEEKKILEDAVAIISKRLGKYGKTKDNFGLIHSDLNINNILVEEEQVKVLDFDDCGYGWFLYDLATSVLEYDDILEPMIKAWIEGYENVRKLSQEDKNEIATFIILRKIVRIGWLHSHRDNDTIKRVTPKYYRRTAEMAEDYIKYMEGR